MVSEDITDLIENNSNSILKDRIINISIKNKIPIYNDDSESMLCSICKSTGVGLFIIDLDLETIIWGNSNFFIMNSIKEKHLCKPMLKDLLFRNLHNEDMSYLKNLNIEQLMNDDQTSVSHTLRYKQKDKSWKYFYFSLLNPKQKLTNKTQLKIGIQYDLTDILSQCTKESTTVSPCFSDDLNFQKLSNLSKREKEILKFIVTGNTDKEIAIQLGISFYTVETHRKNIINKLGVKNTASLSFLAGKYGII